ncbi:alpha/beta hydrolase family esterase [Rhizobium leguminosarum]|uniref:extracellular catalytic domain type 1 short-chain-length polyhydroxyalkanoate depolymerase n=1 Tax=Rhizobium leguminosarum TaxID=384 RepID=UPI001C905443|nr:PHB depolymerase family esterase [Rhizobium leguminosarum]MBY2915358.1 PHB depolymerase family esterase [Rhizobium leguminosarum]MBY2970896.1 PHB depolymerase family esterase [Rhizobium leguminosarum]MBY2977963.1 PHB depolymerase family esterase [Rhizobium leguminosarum]MBY3006513.1 PHB depolymerase family esterase [Rhizobium leguminosarum]
MKFGFGKSLARVLKSQKKFSRLIEKALKAPRKKAKRPTPSPYVAKPILVETTAFGSNPGRLIMKSFVPTARLPKSPALVVVLHGCRQTPESLDRAAGFSKLAKGHGFVLLYPEQRSANNSQRCFNWFRPSAVARDRGELLSIKQMIEHACERHRIDRSRIFVAGLSAGGAMSAALVANYPSLFAGAAIIAGMPVGSARDGMSALRAMKSGAPPPPGGWGRPVTEISSEIKAWPAITIWQGMEDRTVNPLNASACIAQWLEVQGLDEGSGRAEEKPWGWLQSWRTADGLKLAFYSVTNMGHGLPIKMRDATKSRRSGDPYVIAAEISAPAELLRLWGLKRPIL